MHNLREVEVFAGSVVVALVFFLAGGATITERAMKNVSVALQEAAAFLAPTITVTELRSTYENAPKDATVPALPAPPASVRPVRILLVPGHEPGYGGTAFQNVIERDIVVDIAEKLAALLQKNPRYEVTVARTKDAWKPVFAGYFAVQWENIKAFRAEQKQEINSYFESGALVSSRDQVHHNKTEENVALRLYGINKWAGENDIDITLHLHVNDYPGHRKEVGKYSGFTVYVQDRQFANGEASRAVGEAIANRLNAYHATSTLPVESAGVLEDQKLIAVGSHNSVDNASVLIEYGFIYEPQFLNEDILPLAEFDYAYETYLALQDFFGDSLSTYGSGALPYEWSSVLKKGEEGAQVYALQSALRYVGYYPPKGEAFSDCPISGHFGPCTERALKTFQTVNGIEATGIFGPQTRTALSAVFPK